LNRINKFFSKILKLNQGKEQQASPSLIWIQHKTLVFNTKNRLK